MLDNIDNKDLMFKVDCEVNYISLIPHLHSSGSNKFDVLVCLQSLIVEVQSSPMGHTEIQALLKRSTIFSLFQGRLQ